MTRIPPRPPWFDQLGLAQPIDGFGERIIMRIANRTDRRINAASMSRWELVKMGETKAS